MLVKNRLSFSKRINKYINITIDILNTLNNFQIKGPLGKIKFSCSNQQVTFLKNFQIDFLLKKNKSQIFFKNLREALRGVLVPWLRSFVITGYQYKIAYSYKRHQLSIGLGFTYWIVLDLTTDNIIYLKTVKGKLIRSISRKFILTSIDYTEFQILQKFLNTVRHLLPYKLKGLAFPEKKIKLKVGKKVKYR
jgi:ribosomal protein L6P/L9E